jgi:hypothetical protein
VRQRAVSLCHAHFNIKLLYDLAPPSCCSTSIAGNFDGLGFQLAVSKGLGDLAPRLPGRYSLDEPVFGRHVSGRKRSLER